MFVEILCKFIHNYKLLFFSFLHWPVPLHMSPQRTWVRAGKVTLVAFVWLFSTVRFQMSLQMFCPRRCKVTLVAFVWLFSTVRFQMRPQIVCPRRGIVTLVALVWLFSTVCFQTIFSPFQILWTRIRFCMLLFMRGQNVFALEFHGTQCAAEWSLACMNSHVDF